MYFLQVHAWLKNNHSNLVCTTAERGLQDLWICPDLLLVCWYPPYFGKLGKSVCIWTGSYLGFPFKHHKTHFTLLSLYRSCFPQNKLNTLYPDANLTDIPPNLLLLCLLLCKISVCCNFFLFWIPKSWLIIFPQCSLPLI